MGWEIKSDHVFLYTGGFRPLSSGPGYPYKNEDSLAFVAPSIGGRHLSSSLLRAYGGLR